MSRPWSRFFRAWYRGLRLIEPLIRAWYRAFGIGNVVEVLVPGRRSGRERAVLLGLLRVDGRRYLGHPNAACAWTRNLDAAGTLELRARGRPPERLAAARLPAGAEREAVIRATWRQHPFPGDLLYRLARGHVRAGGVFYRLETSPAAGDAPGAAALTAGAPGP